VSPALIDENLVERNPYGILLATLPYRFYPVLLIGFVFLVAYSGRDFGSMRTAESVTHSSATAADESPPAAGRADSKPLQIRHALIPVGVLLGVLVVRLLIPILMNQRLL